MSLKRFKNITTNTTTTVISGQAVLEAVVINTKGATSNTATVYNGPAASADPVAAIDTTSELETLEYGCVCPNGIYVVTATGTAANLTIIYS